ncbi:ornithine decarboxylase [Pseudohalioglobus lutimaris]|uniref:ornithine decarboxylase n=1 Tax=Pseudohalioglobus lutimaris TaxID=1737061 RepID=A0A2N5X2P7_9GAMM|nr:ornithine decarboxylase [Pseudohalioglobus lutimaris]PLW68764.1 ornithine decarboxylase [Pseudohalioglobus lutimaris]
MTGSNASVFNRPPTKGGYADCAEITGRVQPLDPLYLFCADTLRRRARCFTHGFPGQVSYAVKANPEARVLETLSSFGMQSFDVASLDEVRRVVEHCPGSTLHFNNPIKAQESITEAYLRYGVRSFAIDEVAELEKVHRCTGGDTQITYTVRFKLDHAGAAYDFGSKFGANEDAAVALLKNIRARGARAALTFHPGSQCTDPQMYVRYIKAAAGIIRRAAVPLQFLNVGGGFPEHYPGTALPSLEEYFDAIKAAARQHLDRHIPLICEPGRAMVAPAVSLLTRIIHVRDCGNSLFLNDGVYGGMQEQSLIDLSLPVRAWQEGRLLQAPLAGYHIFGPTCDPVDRLSRETRLPAGLRPGDYLEFGLLGAYGSVTATRFNGFHSGTYVNVSRSTEF